MNKKGSTRDIFLIVILGFGLVIASLMALKVMSVINTEFQAQPDSSVSAQAKTVLSTVNTRLPKWVDGAFLMFWILFMVVGMFLAFQIQTNPVFLPISIFYFIFMVFISRLFASMYNQLVASSILSTEAGLLTIIPYIVPRLHIFSFVFGALIVGIMVIKR